MKLSIPENLYAYTKDDSKLFEGAILYSYQLMEWNEHRLPDNNSLMYYIDNNQFHYLLAIGKSDNDTIEYCRQEANKHIQVLVSESYIPQPVEESNSDLPF